jgi:outer membrane cobalamin receptor
LTTDLTRPATEARTKVDLGLRGTWAAFGEATLTAFGVYQNATTVYANDTRRGPDGQPVALVRNGLARSYGIECDARTRRFETGTQLFVNLVAVQTELHADARWARDHEVPRVIAGGGVSQTWRHWDLAFLAKHVGQYQNDRFVTPAVPLDLGDFVHLGANVSYWFGQHRRSKVHLSADNLLDETYSTVNGYPHSGLTVSGGVSLVF